MAGPTHQQQANNLACNRSIQADESDNGEPRAWDRQAVEVREDTLADAEYHQQAEAVNLDFAQRPLPGGRQIQEGCPVRSRQGGPQVGRLIDRLDDEPGDSAGDVVIVNG